MGLFDFFRKQSPKNSPPEGAAKRVGSTSAGAAKRGGSASAGVAAAPVDRKIAGPAKIAGDKRAQTYDRIEAIQQLVDMKSPDAAAALLKRFTFTIDPSITDSEEKDLAFQGVVDAGKDVVPAVLEFCVKAEVLTWPLKILRELLDDEAYHDELITLLEAHDTEYARNVEPKLQIIMALEHVKSDEVREAVEPFLDDANETVRFHAVETTFAQNKTESIPVLIKLLSSEESVRIKNKIAEGLHFRGWVIPSELRDAAAEALRDTSGYGVGEGGKVTKGSPRY